jgi:flagellar protein FliS
MLKAAKAYMATQVSTASQGDLLVMLYDTAVKHLRLAIEKMRAGDMAGKGILITKAITIVSELQESLNKERGGEISKNLFHLYMFCNTRLLTANLKVQPAMVEEVITILSGLRQAFAQILPNQEGVASLTQPGAEGQPAAQQAAVPQASVAAPAAPQPRPEEPAAPQLASAPELAAALYVPTQIPTAAASAPQSAAADDPAAKAPALQPLAAPEAPVHSANAPGLRLRAANAYATTR